MCFRNYRPNKDILLYCKQFRLPILKENMMSALQNHASLLISGASLMAQAKIETLKLKQIMFPSCTRYKEEQVRVIQAYEEYCQKILACQERNKLESIKFDI